MPVFNLKVYIAGPYTKGDVAVNVRNAILAADVILAAGHIPYVPHLSHFWHFVSPHDYETWLDLDLKWLESCDVLIRLSGESSGADGEVARANELGIRVYFGVGEFIASL